MKSLFTGFPKWEFGSDLFSHYYRTRIMNPEIYAVPNVSSSG